MFSTRGNIKKKLVTMRLLRRAGHWLFRGKLGRPSRPKPSPPRSPGPRPPCARS